MPEVHPGEAVTVAHCAGHHPRPLGAGSDDAHTAPHSFFEGVSAWHSWLGVIPLRGAGHPAGDYGVFGGCDGGIVLVRANQLGQVADGGGLGAVELGLDRVYLYDDLAFITVAPEQTQGPVRPVIPRVFLVGEVGVLHGERENHLVWVERANQSQRREPQIAVVHGVRLGWHD